MPPVFDAYVRIPHPAEADDGRPVCWAEVADAQGTTLHAAAEFARLARRTHSGHPHGWPGRDPYGGSLDRQSLEALVGALASHTATPRTLWLNVWNGFGRLPKAWAGRPLVDQEQGHREYYAFRCALDEVVDVSRWFEQIRWDLADEDESTFVVTAEYVGDGDPRTTSRHGIPTSRTMACRARSSGGPRIAPGLWRRRSTTTTRSSPVRTH